MGGRETQCLGGHTLAGSPAFSDRQVGRDERQAAGNADPLPVSPQGWEQLLLVSQHLGSNPVFKSPVTAAGTRSPECQVKILPHLRGP